MSVRGPRLAVFVAAVSAGLVSVMGLAAVGADEGFTVEPTTGRVQVEPWRRAVELRDVSDLGALRAEVQQFASEFGTASATTIARLGQMVERELGAPRFRDDVGSDPTRLAPVEAFFGPTAGPTSPGLDARAAFWAAELRRGSTVDAERLVTLADEFEAAGRPVAAVRWLQRATTRAPAHRDAAMALARLHIAHGDLEGALHVVDRHVGDRANDLEWQRTRARLGAWLGRAALEADALEHVVALAPEPAGRARLIELYAHLGTPERGLPHAVAIADGADAAATSEAAARAALQAGFVAEGLGMLERAAARSPARGTWLRRFAVFAGQDLRLDAAGDALAAAAQATPGSAEIAAALVEHYRRTDQPRRLVEVLERELLRRPGDPRLWHEVITLRAALGDHDAATALGRERDIALADPEAFLAAVPAERRAAAGAVRAEALQLALAGPTDGAIVGATLDRLRGFFAQREFRELAELLLARHPEDPRAKPMRRELVDYGRTPRAALTAAAALSATYPDDLELAELWLERAQWANDVPGQIAARMRVRELAPTDFDNRYALADLLEYGDEPDRALTEWCALVEECGLGSPAAPRVVDALFQTGREAEALEWLRRLAERPDATIDDRLRAADQLFWRRSYDRAQALYAAVLRHSPEHPAALLRLGQIAIWTNDPRRARAFLQRRLAATADDAGLVRFYLGEACWTLGEAGAARALHRAALAEFEALAEPDIVTRGCIATMLARLGDLAGATAAYRDLVARSPRDADLVLDYADLALRSGDLGLAGALGEQAAALEPGHPRLMRLLGTIAAERGDLLAADRYYDEVLAREGPDAALLGEQTEMRSARGEWRRALESATAWRRVQPDSVAAVRTETELRERLADVAIGEVEHRRLGDDRGTTVAFGGRIALAEREWLQGRVGYVERRGVTSLGSGRAESEYARLELGWGRRFANDDRFVVGLTASPGVEGDVPIGLFAALDLRFDGPLELLRVRARLHDVWDEPMAAPALGGRRSSIDVAGYTELGRSLWTAFEAGLDRLSIEPDGAADRSDPRWRGEVALGYRLVDGDVAAAARFSPLGATAGPDSPFLLAEPAATRSWLVNTWLSWRAAHLMGDAELATVLPVLPEDEFVTGAVRVDRHVARGHGLSVTGFVGADTNAGDSVWGIETMWTWRPSFHTEVALRGRFGESLGRAGDGEERMLGLQVVTRW